MAMWCDTYFLDISLLLLLLVCSYTDLKKRKIYNKVILLGVIIGLVGNIYFQGVSAGLPFALKGFFLGIGLLIIPFISGGLGAGDVKLLGVVGIYKGVEFTFYAFLLSALWGGLFSVIILVKQKRLLLVLKNIGQSLKVLFLSGFKVNTLPDTSSSPSEFSIPYAPAIAAGVLLVYAFKYFNFW